MVNFLKDTLACTFNEGQSGVLGNIKWYCPASGAIIFEPDVWNSNILISAGIHGNETAPVEIVDQLVSEIFCKKIPLKSRVMFLLGNIDALRQGARYLNLDMNRLFGENDKTENSPEICRAELIKKLSLDFFNKTSEKGIHLDLHTAIRNSKHERFGLLPYVKGGRYPKSWLSFLASIGLDALVVNHAPSTTYTYFSKNECKVQSVTLELGKALPFGQNDLSKFQKIKEGISALISESSAFSKKNETKLKIYKVTQVLIKNTSEFKLTFAEDVANFTGFHRGYLLAEDGDFNYQVEEEKEYILFPNNDVKIGLRGGLMLREDRIECHIRD